MVNICPLGCIEVVDKVCIPPSNFSNYLVKVRIVVRLIPIEYNASANSADLFFLIVLKMIFNKIMTGDDIVITKDDSFTNCPS